MRETLPEGFQRSEFLLEHGAIDLIVDRRDLRDRIARAACGAAGPAAAEDPPSPPEMPSGQSLPPTLARLAGLAAVAASARDRSRARPRAGAVLARTRLAVADLPGRHRRRHQRQGLVRRAARGDAAARAAIASATFTSPHLRRLPRADPHRRRAGLRGLAGRRRSSASHDALGDSLTFFEFNTLAALLMFETAALDAIVLEVGMGGRLDAVNVVDADVAVVVIRRPRSHASGSAPTLEAIGREKAGIFRRGQAGHRRRGSRAEVRRGVRAGNRCRPAHLWPGLRRARECGWLVELP